MKLKIIQIASSYKFNVFLTQEGELYKSGLISEISELEKVEKVPKCIKSISAGRNFVSLVTNNRKLFCYGNSITKSNQTLQCFDSIDENVEIASCSNDSIFFVTSTKRAGVVGSLFSDILTIKWNDDPCILEIKGDKKDSFINCVGGKQKNSKKIIKIKKPF